MTTERPDRRIEAHLRDWRAGHSTPADLVVDVLATLRHFADAHEVDFGQADYVAHNHYIAELGENRATEHAGPIPPVDDRTPDNDTGDEDHDTRGILEWGE